jgi:hypothetical protein
MVGQILPNNNEKCYCNFSPHFSQLNTAVVLISTKKNVETRTEVKFSMQLVVVVFRGITANEMKVNLIFQKDFQNELLPFDFSTRISKTELLLFKMEKIYFTPSL